MLVPESFEFVEAKEREGDRGSEGGDEKGGELGVVKTGSLGTYD